jgi:glycosyltransferase involved in cell wall biosynthesis
MSERAIVQVVLWNSPYLGNVMTSQLALARAVRERFGLSTHFVLAAGAEGQPWHHDLEAAGTSWSILPGRRSEWHGHIAGLLRDGSAALAHAHFTAADLMTARAARRLRIPCVWHVRTGFNGYPARQRIKDLYKMRWVAQRDIARIVAVSPWLGELLRRRGAPADRIEVIPNAIVLERFAQMPSRDEARARFGLDRDAQVVLGLGWWPDVKGADVFLDALTQIAPRQPSLQALLVGEEALRAFLAERFATLPSWLRVSGFVEDSAWLFAAADAFVSASRHEGQSSAIGEAVGCGLPVVMSDIPGTAGWGAAPGVETFRSTDAEQLAARVEPLLVRPAAERAKVATLNRAWARANVGIDRWCEQICDVYERLL